NLQRLFGGESDTSDAPSSDPKILDASTWGPVLAIRALFDQLGLWSILETHLGKAHGVPFVDRAFVLIANRLIRPSSEHGLAGWLEPDSVCDRRGRRFVPQLALAQPGPRSLQATGSLVPDARSVRLRQGTDRSGPLSPAP